MVEIFNIRDGLVIGLLNLDEYAVLHQLTLKRDIETQGKQYLINFMCDAEITLFYNEDGKPFILNDKRHISISHSHSKIAIILNDFEPTGIDIELIRKKVLKIKHKFLTELELEDTGLDVEKNILYWAAKETLYKIDGRKEVDFMKQLKIEPFKIQNEGTMIGSVCKTDSQKKVLLHYFKIEDYMLVYANKII